MQAQCPHQHTHSPTPQPGVAGRSRIPSPNTHTHGTHPSQEWRGASGAPTPAHTQPNTRARSGGVQPKPEPKDIPPPIPQPGVAGYKGGTHTNTHTPTPQRGVAGRSRNPSPSTQTHAAHPGQEWRGTGGAGKQTRPPQHPSHRPHPGHTGCGTPAARSRGRAAGGGTAPDTRRPSQRWKAPPPGTPFRHPHSEQRRPARAHAVGPVQGPHARIDRTRDTRVAEPWLPTPEDGRPGEGQRLTPGAPHNGGRHPPRGRPSATPTASNAGPQGRTHWGRCWVHTPTSTAPGTHGLRNPGCPLQRTGGRGKDSA